MKIVYLFALLFVACMHPGWNKIAGSNTWNYIFKQSPPTGFREIKGEMHEFRSIFLFSETWEWYLKGEMTDTLFKEMVPGNLKFQKINASGISPFNGRRTKIPDWFIKELSDSLEFYKSVEFEFMIWRDPRTKTVWMTDYGIQ